MVNAQWSQMMNPYVRQMQQQQIQQQWQQQQQLQHQLLRNAMPGASPTGLSKPTNHSISSMIDSCCSTENKHINKPKKLGFSISAIVGEESEPETETSEEMPVIEEVVDVVSDDQDHSDQEAIEPAQSPCHSAGNDSHDSGNASSLTSAPTVSTPPLIDDDLRRALTIDPRTLSPEEKSRLRQKLAEIALRNISQDSGVCTEVC